MNALFDNTDGADNTAIGVSALYNNVSGTENTAVGVFALYSNGYNAGSLGIENTASEPASRILAQRPCQQRSHQSAGVPTRKGFMPRDLD